MAPEKRLIDANKLSEQMAANFDQCVYYGASSAECQIALDTISEAPTVDAVEVVRCGECRFGRRINRTTYCEKSRLCMKSEDFCSYGERG